MRSDVVIPVVTGVISAAAGYGLGFYTAQPVCNTFAFIGMIVVLLVVCAIVWFIMQQQQQDEEGTRRRRRR